MNMVEIVLITIGVSWEIFATLECQGALVAKLEKKRLALAVILTSLWQTIALFHSIPPTPNTGCLNCKFPSPYCTDPACHVLSPLPGL